MQATAPFALARQKSEPELMRLDPQAIKAANVIEASAQKAAKAAIMEENNESKAGLHIFLIG